MFKSRPEHYARNIEEGPIFKAAQATLRAPDGQEQPAVVLYAGHKVRSVLPAAEALRVANEIADAIAAHNGNGNNQ